MRRAVFVVFALLLVSACEKPAASNSNAAAEGTDARSDAANEPTPNYSDQEGDRYFYVTEVSEDDKKKGKAAGDVVQYRFLGEKNGVLALEEVAENGHSIGRLECRRNCQIMKFTSDGQVLRIPFGNSSIANAVMEDAINGFLKPVTAPSAPMLAKRIPAIFIGKWNPDPSDCGIGYDAGAVFVAPGKLTFYESGLDVARVEVLGPSRAKVTGTLTDEEGGRSTMAYTLSLRDEKLLVDGSLPRTRCSD